MSKFISLNNLSEFLTKCKSLFYTKPNGGVPKTDLAQSVQTSLGKADSAYQKPNSGIPKTDLASGVQSSLDLANSSVQANPVGSVTPAVDPYDYATKAEVSQLGQKVTGVIEYSFTSATGEHSSTADKHPIEYAANTPIKVTISAGTGACDGTSVKVKLWNSNNVAVYEATITLGQEKSFTCQQDAAQISFYLWRVTQAGTFDVCIINGGVENELNTLSESVTYLENNNYTDVTGVASLLKQRYIKYSDGSMQTTGSAIWVYKIPATGITKVKVFVTAADNVPAAIAFYSSDVVSSENYISGVQMVGNTGGGQWYETTVPSDAVIICVTNHQSFVTNPVILVNALSKALLGTEEKSIPEQGIGIVYGYQKADNYDGTFSPIYTNNSYFPLESFQSRIRLTPLYGIRINIKQVGVLTIVKATGVLTENCIMTTIKAFTTTITGWQVLLFDAPVTLSESESLGIGIKTDTAKVVVDSVYGGENSVQTNYLHYTQNVWTVYQQNLLIDVLGIPKNDAEEALTKAQSLEKRDVFAGNNPFRFNGPFYAHLFLDKIYETSTDITVPSESLDDIRVSRRLGFNVIEANVHATSDGKFVVIHGASGKFGYEVTDLNGDFTYADTAINSVTLDWIKTNLRYRSDIPRFRTAIPTFEEFLCECRLQGMIPFAQASTSALVALLDGIMGYGNYFAYNGTRALTTAPIVEYLSLTTKADILARARSIGVPYVYAMANFTSFTDDELKDIVSSLHAEGFMIAAAYTHSVYIDKLRKIGFDMIASQWNVNNFDNANLCTLCVGTDWSDFQITGSSATDAGVELGEGDSITPANALGTEFLAKGMLQVTFTGTIRMKCGKDEQDVASDGANSVIFSSYFINSAPTFTIYGKSAGAVVKDIVFKASKC